MNFLRAALFISSLTFAGSAWAVPVTVGSFTFDESAFADTATVAAGSVVDVSTLVGSDLDTILLANTPGSVIEFGFTDNTILNVAGFDVFLFELGQPENSLLSLTQGGPGIAGVLLESSAVNNAGTTIHTFGYDLSNLGIAPGAEVASMLLFVSNTLVSGEPDLAGIATRGVRKAVSEPSLLLLMIFAFTGLHFFSRRRRMNGHPNSNPA